MAMSFIATMFSENPEPETDVPVEEVPRPASFREPNSEFPYTNPLKSSAYADSPASGFHSRVNDYKVERFSETVPPGLLTNRARLEKIRESLTSFSDAGRTGPDSSPRPYMPMLSKSGQTSGRNEKTERENAELRKALAETKVELSQAKHYLENYMGKTEAARKRVAETRDALQQAKTNIAQHMSFEKEHNEALERTKREIECLLAEQRADHECINRLQIENVKYSDQMSAMETELAQAREELAKHKKDSKDWKHLQEKADVKYEAAHHEVHELRKKLDKTIREKIDLESRHEMLIDNNNSKTKHLSQKISSHEKTISSLESRIGSLESQLDIANKRIELLNVENDELKEDTASRDETVLRLTSKLDYARKAHEQDLEALYKSGDRITELDNHVKTLVARLDHESSEKNAYAAIVMNLGKVNTELSEKLVTDEPGTENRLPLPEPPCAIKENDGAVILDLQSKSA